MLIALGHLGDARAVRALGSRGLTIRARHDHAGPRADAGCSATISVERCACLPRPRACNVEPRQPRLRGRRTRSLRHHRIGGAKRVWRKRFVGVIAKRERAVERQHLPASPGNHRRCRRAPSRRDCARDARTSSIVRASPSRCARPLMLQRPAVEQLHRADRRPRALRRGVHRSHL